MGRRRLPAPTLRFDRRFRGVGRINLSSGTSSKKEFIRRDALLTELADAGQLEALRAFQAGDLAIEQLIEAKRSGELTSNWLLRDVRLDLNLWDALDELYGETKDRSTYHRYRSTSVKFAKIAFDTIGRRARIRDLRRIDWQRLRLAWGGGAADWNHLRRMISRSLTHWMGDVYDPFRREVVKRIPREREIPRIPDITIPMFWDIVARTPDFAQPCYVTLVATAMRLGEYLACDKRHLSPATCSIDVPGTKTADSKARIYVDEPLWPWIEAGIPAPLNECWIRHYWKRGAREVGKGELRLHDLRHAYAIFASDAGVPTAQIQAALRHAGPEMTRRYEMQRSRRSVAVTVGQALLHAKRVAADPTVLPMPRGSQPPAPVSDHRRGKRRARLLAEYEAKRARESESGDMPAEAL
jgi:integrase